MPVLKVAFGNNSLCKIEAGQTECIIGDLKIGNLGLKCLEITQKNAASDKQ